MTTSDAPTTPVLSQPRTLVASDAPTLPETSAR